MIDRLVENQIITSLHSFPIVGVLGPRQAGKTTLVKKIATQINGSIYLDMELPSDFNKLREPELFFKEYENRLVIIDEVQHKADLFPLLRALIDQNRIPGRFLITGSATPDLLRQSSESLAGRIAYIELPPFSLPEVGGDFKLHWLRGGFPGSFTAPDETVREAWLRNYITAYIERDLPLWGLPLSPQQSRNFILMNLGINGSLLNMSTLAKSIGVAQPTVKRYLELLEHTFLIRMLPAFHFNIKKRIVKSPKLFFRDSGILHHLAGIGSLNDLYAYSAVGHSWEAYVIQQICSHLVPQFRPYFYRTQDGAEMDLLLIKGESPVAGIEIKFSNTPHLTKGNINAIQDLQTKLNLVVTPSVEDFPLNKNVKACNINSVWDYLRELKAVDI